MDAIKESMIRDEDQNGTREEFLTQRLAERGEELESFKRRYENECDTVDRVWKALGISTYEEAGGKAIWEFVAELVNKSKSH